MCLFVEAAKAWQQLTKTRYSITAGRKGKLYQFRLEFDNADFPHLAGMQYAQNVDFGLHISEYYGDKLVPALLSGKMDGGKIEKSRSWEKIKGRLHAIISLQQTLESDFSIALFDPAKSNSKINALYVIKNNISGETYFVFIDKDNGHRHYCKSAFAQNCIDYTKNQSLLTRLKIDKVYDGKTYPIYRHPNFKEITADIL